MLKEAEAILRLWTPRVILTAWMRSQICNMITEKLQVSLEKRNIFVDICHLKYKSHMHAKCCRNYVLKLHHATRKILFLSVISLANERLNLRLPLYCKRLLSAKIALCSFFIGRYVTRSNFWNLVTWLTCRWRFLAVLDQILFIML